MSNNDSSDTSERKHQVSDLFDRVATTFDHVGPRFFSHFGRRLVEFARIPNGAHVLDVATARWVEKVRERRRNRKYHQFASQIKCVNILPKRRKTC